MSGCSKLGETNLAAITVANLILEDRASLPENQPALLACAKAGDRQALFALYHAHAGRIYSLSLSVTKDVNAAENLTRDIFVAAFTGLDDVTDDAAFAARLYRCAAKSRLRMGSKAATLKASGIDPDRISILASSGAENLATHSQ
jgi:DNA-directed RNA polymerase specialized sigma24 family protein